MSFNVKVTLGTAVLILIALAAVFLFRSSEEKVIEKMLEEGLAAAERGDEAAVVALISPNYKNGTETRESVVRKIHQAVAQRITPAKLGSVVIQVSGEDADANATVVVGALQYRKEFGLRLKMKKEAGAWKVTSADEVGR